MVVQATGDGKKMDTLQKVKEKEKEFEDLWKRMDRTAGLLKLTPYKLKRLDMPAVDVDQVVNVTLNSAAVLANSVASVLIRAVMQTTVEGQKNSRKMNAKETSRIESFIETNNEEIDNLLLLRNLATLKVWLANHLVTRGSVCVRYWPYLEDGLYYPEAIYWDTRYTSYQFGRRGLEWIACHMKRTQGQVLSEYPDIKLRQDVKVVDVVCYLDEEKEEVWFGTEQVRGQRHDWGRVPAVLQVVSSGFMLKDEDWLKFEGEDVLQFDRELFDEQNRTATIEQTLAMKTILAPRAGESADPSRTLDNPDQIGKISTYDPGETPQLIEQPDVNVAAQQGRIDINGAIAEGGLNAVDRGDINMPSSAVAITALSEIRGKLQEPRLQVMAQFMQKFEQMACDFHCKLTEKNSSFGIGGGLHNVFKRQDFEGSWNIRYTYMTKDKRQEIANIAVYQATRGELPLEIRVRDILKAENPDEVISKLNSEAAEDAEPAIKLIRMAHSLVDKAEEQEGYLRDSTLLEAKMLTERAAGLIRASQMMQQPEPVPEQKTGNANILMPLLGEGSMGRTRQEAEVK